MEYYILESNVGRQFGVIVDKQLNLCLCYAARSWQILWCIGRGTTNWSRRVILIFTHGSGEPGTGVSCAALVSTFFKMMLEWRYRKEA